jgi:outer membrane protein TolC
MANFQTEQANARAIALSVEATVIFGYIILRSLNAQLELTEATVELRQQPRDLAQRQFERGDNFRLGRRRRRCRLRHR